MDQKKLVNEVGNPVEKERFFDRKAELNLFIEMLDESSHILLIAQRRVGKTSLMKEVAGRIEGRYHCLFIDVQECATAEEALQEIMLRCMSHRALGRVVMDVVQGLTGCDANATLALSADELSKRLRHGLTGDWKHWGTRIVDALATADLRVVLFIDELPLLVNRMLKGGSRGISEQGRAETDLFLSWLRAATIRLKGHIRFVVSGSIGLGPILRMAGLSATVSTFHPFNLGPWDKATATDCLNALAANYELVLGPKAPQTVVARLGCCIPHHVQMFFSLLRQDASRRTTSTITSADVERVYLEGMLGTRGHAELAHMEERLQQVLEQSDLVLVTDLLSEAAMGRLDGQAARFLAAANQSERKLDLLLEFLEHDGYLRPHGGGHRFVSALLKDWWAARHRATYVPARRREGWR